MPVINITMWESDDISMKQKLIKEVTRTAHTIIGCPLDKISVYIQEVPNTLWGDAGILGDDPEFATSSRRQKYEK